ncbi:Uma2 family endonuclease [Trichocoleus sp. FACHB-69]|uniref:Uma2 family endonuclease n=1 Tax=Trichocoleus sp. FACHB-69 TaxID=2692874 RepID=UPI0028C4EA8F|nr:Uma2 family endonuclease [Trichocoleus sp. FACHB-69]
MDWFFGVNVGIYYMTDRVRQTPLVPDDFLRLNVERRKKARGFLSCVLWEENYVVLIFALEVVSQTYGVEYDEKQTKYSQLGVLYYLIYNPEYSRRD